MYYDREYWNDVEKVIECIPDYQRLFGHSFFITGASGMICSSIIEILLKLNKDHDAGIEIYAGSRNKESFEKRFGAFSHVLHFVEYDALSDKEMNITADYIIHGASNAHPEAFAKEPVETMLANVNGLNSILNNVKKGGKTKRVLYISSSEVYGKKDNKRPYVEDDYGYVDILNPRAAYPSSKRASETLCLAYQKEYGVDTVIVRPGHIYGPSITQKDSRASAVFSRMAKKGEPIVMKSKGLQLRSYMYTLDCASAILAVLFNGKSGQAYNISNPDSLITLREMAVEIAKAGNVEIVYENPSDNEVSSYNLMENSALNSDKLTSLGWRGCFGIKEGATKTLHYLEL